MSDFPESGRSNAWKSAESKGSYRPKPADQDSQCEQVVDTESGH